MQTNNAFELTKNPSAILILLIATRHLPLKTPISPPRSPTAFPANFTFNLWKIAQMKSFFSQNWSNKISVREKFTKQNFNSQKIAQTNSNFL